MKILVSRLKDRNLKPQTIKIINIKDMLKPFYLIYKLQVTYQILHIWYKWLDTLFNTWMWVGDIYYIILDISLPISNICHSLLKYLDITMWLHTLRFFTSLSTSEYREIKHLLSDKKVCSVCKFKSKPAARHFVKQLLKACSNKFGIIRPQIY